MRKLSVRKEYEISIADVQEMLIPLDYIGQRFFAKIKKKCLT